jgi:hypothetical protein
VPPRKKTTARPPALTNDEVAGLRARLSAGEKPRVIVRAASAAVPAGTRGNVIRMGSPSEGEFIVVRLGRDEVPFAPSELALSARGKTATAAARSAPAKKAARPSTTKKTAAKKAVTKKAAPAKAPVKTAPANAPAKPARRAAVKKASRKGAHPLTVTLRFNDGRWTVEAQRGARRLARASVVRPGAVQTFAELIDDDTVREAVSEIVASNRTVAEEKAEKLRAELEAAEAALEEYDARRR